LVPEQQPQKGRLAGPGGADEERELSVSDLHADVRQGGSRHGGVRLGHMRSTDHTSSVAPRASLRGARGHDVGDAPPSTTPPPCWPSGAPPSAGVCGVGAVVSGTAVEAPVGARSGVDRTCASSSSSSSWDVGTSVVTVPSVGDVGSVDSDGWSSSLVVAPDGVGVAGSVGSAGPARPILSTGSSRTRRYSPPARRNTANRIAVVRDMRKNSPASDNSAGFDRLEGASGSGDPARPNGSVSSAIYAS